MFEKIATLSWKIDMEDGYAFIRLSNIKGRGPYIGSGTHNCTYIWFKIIANEWQYKELSIHVWYVTVRSFFYDKIMKN